MMRSTQSKFEEFLKKACEDQDFELIKNSKYANTGTYQVEEPGNLVPRLLLKYSWQDGYVSFNATPDVPNFNGYYQTYQIQEALNAITAFLKGVL